MRLLSALMVWMLLALPALAERVALVMGNGDYRFSDPLKNATNDAADMAARLRGMGFVVYDGLNLDRNATLRLVQDFANRLSREDTALFFYAGHGMQLGSDNYILPVDARPGTEAELTDSAVRVQTILASMENAANTRIVILDACRNNPFLRSAGSRSAAPNRGFMKMEAGVGSFIAFSTEPGNLASDGAGRNSPFTAALLRHIDTPGADIHAVMRAVRSEVIDVTRETQVPWENSALIDQVFLTAAPAPAPATTTAAPQVALLAPQAAPATRSVRPGEICLRGSDHAFCADSALPSQGSNSYGPANLFDNDPTTAWVEGVSGTGEGQRLSFDFDAPRDLQELFVVNGYAKSGTTYQNNARVAQMRLTTPDGSALLLNLADDPNWQRFDLSEFRAITWLQLEITRVYPGSRYADTALSELALLDRPTQAALPQQVQPQVGTPQVTTDYQVTGLDPYGDGFLALRSGPSSGTTLLRKMPEGTGLSFLGRDGAWFRVRTADGQDGWAHSQWIRRFGSIAVRDSGAVGQSCDALWTERNGIFHDAGYCFSSDRGRAAFPAQGCIAGLGAGDVLLTDLEKARIAAIQARESALGCR